MLFPCRMPGMTAMWISSCSFNLSLNQELEESGYLSFISSCKMTLLARIPRYSTVRQFCQPKLLFCNLQLPRLGMKSSSGATAQSLAESFTLFFIFFMANGVASFYFTIFWELFKARPLFWNLSFSIHYFLIHLWQKDFLCWIKKVLLWKYKAKKGFRINQDKEQNRLD